MSISTHTGMNTYNRILQDARSNGDPIGPKHHEFNKHLKQYLARQSNLKTLAKARDVKKTKGELRKTRQAINEAKAKIATRAAEVNQETELREKYRKMQIDKIANGYKAEERNPEVKSRGNGL
jgi:hypothetical protein